jgi:hypothetical protein
VNTADRAAALGRVWDQTPNLGTEHRPHGPAASAPQLPCDGRPEELAAVVTFLAVLTLAALGFFIVLAVGLAYVETPYLTINGRTYAFKREYGVPDPDTWEC